MELLLCCSTWLAFSRKAVRLFSLQNRQRFLSESSRFGGIPSADCNRNFYSLFFKLLGAYIATFMVDRAGRKVLLTVSAFGMAFGMTVFGVATQLMDHGHGSAFIKLIPVFALSFSVFVANIGVFTLTFVILSEITPANVSMKGSTTGLIIFRSISARLKATFSHSA